MVRMCERRLAMQGHFFSFLLGPIPYHPRIRVHGTPIMSLARLSAFPHRRRHVIADWQSNRMTEVFAYRVRDTFMLFGTGDFCLNIPRRREYYCIFHLQCSCMETAY